MDKNEVAFEDLSKVSGGVEYMYKWACRQCGEIRYWKTSAKKVNCSKCGNFDWEAVEKMYEIG